MSNLDYSNSSGPHPTLAGNVLDPNVRSDGNMSGGPGVGGTSEQHVREEGAEHIRQNPDTTQGGLSSSGLGSSSGNGLSSFGGGGVSGSSYEGDRSTGSELGQTTSSSSGGVIGSTLSYLGLGGKSGGQQSGLTEDSTSSYTSGTGSTAVGGSSSYEPQSSSYGQTSTSSREPQLESYSNPGYGSNSTGYGSSAAETALGGAGVAGVASTLGSERETSSYGGQSGDSSYGGQSTGGLGSGDSSYGGQSTGGYGGSSGIDPREEVATRTPRDSNVNTGSDPLDSQAPTDTDTADRDASVSKQSYEAKLHDKHASTRENEDAIPTAGGEKLGSKHWGESKIVPENPKPQGGVSSDEFSSKVRDNTNRNTGAISEPTGTGAHEKESVVDKLKDKLHLGNSLGSSDAA